MGTRPKTKRKLRREELELPKDSFPAVFAHCVNRALETTTDEGLLALLKPLPGHVRARDWSRVVATTELMATQEYASVLDQYVNNQIVALVKKYPFNDEELPGFDPEKAAWTKFLAAEHRCKRVNQRSRLLRHGVGFAYGDMVVSMKRYIRMVLGDKPDYQKIYDLCNWGPGANVGVSGDLTNYARKFLARRWTVTRGALSYVTQALWSNDQLRVLLLQTEASTHRLVDGDVVVCYDREKFADIVRSRVRLVTNNNVNFVPKTFKTYRSIASEPLLNGYLQKGVDVYMRGRLLAIGIDLRNQELNQHLAKAGSIPGAVNPYATIDLSSASDSMSQGIVKTLLPPAWYEFLDSIRAHQYSYQGAVCSYEKFVSMGNGFCFPLQTLLFAACCHASCEATGVPDDFRVYGDDIIVRQSVALLVVELLRYLGFRTNPDKTYVVGPFRESCGSDWHSGTDIRPVYVDERMEQVLAIYKCHNSSTLREMTHWFFEPVRQRLRNLVPEHLRFVRPYHGSADSAFTVAMDEAMGSQFVWWCRKRWHWRWFELKSSAVPDKLREFDPAICNELRYIVGLRSRERNPVPFAVRRKSRVSITRKGGWGLPGDSYPG